jgi:hypothetical protein
MALSREPVRTSGKRGSIQDHASTPRDRARPAGPASTDCLVASWRVRFPPDARHTALHPDLCSCRCDLSRDLHGARLGTMVGRRCDGNRPRHRIGILPSGNRVSSPVGRSGASCPQRMVVREGQGVGWHSHQLSARNGGNGSLRFAHSDWSADTEYFLSCNTTWGEFMFRIKSSAEGKPQGPRFLADSLAD